ncbi:hypothetical protein PDE_00808 [Penicillium oxalicum 114-2]|uniref:Cytochrome P450 n=1 Tax=Penicillium oxalicum (strain 114-2 / CGMCC 5302) TaxID=933388 RepID=S8AVJ7_PENO1|nr:hypothetical protein PDE_00808 [Penicillium oxalicum 114-2]
MFYFAIVSVCVLLSGLWLLSRNARGNKKPLPPGPKALPIIGNLHQMPLKDPWLKYREWHQTYGPIISLKIGLRTFISIGSHEVARDLLTKKSGIYSSRPRFIITGECAFRDLNTAMIPYGPQWRTHHRIQSTFLKPKYTAHYGPIQDLESKHLIHELLPTSEKNAGGKRSVGMKGKPEQDFPSLFLRYAYSINSTLAYGQRVEDILSPSMVELSSVSKAIAQISATTMGGLVEIYPFLKHLPECAAPWKKSARKAYERALRLYEENIRQATASPAWNWTQGGLAMKEGQSISSEEFANVLGFVFDAGSETVCGALEMFVLAAVTYPAVMQKAQTEIHQVVGDGRLPAMEDLVNLPYTCALATESLRWRPLVPLGFPHALMEEDEYMGYRIPKGATVLPCHWAMDLDETIFEKPTEFIPERWLENKDLPLAAFGFGRRGCPGRFVAKDSMCMAIARMLWTFDIVAPAQVDTWKLKQGALTPPEHFVARFQLRSPERRDVFEAEWNRTEKSPEKVMDTIKSLAG